MKPWRWVRWKVLAVAIVVSGLLYVFGIDPLARWTVNRAGVSNDTARWSVAEVALGLLHGDLDLEKVAVASVRRASAAGAAKDGASAGAEEEVLDAASASFDLSVVDALRRRFVVEEVLVRTPRVTVVRRPDGSTNIGDLGAEEEPAVEEPPGENDEPTDWVQTAKEWYEKIQRWRKKLPARGKREQEEEDGGGEVGSYYERRARYPFAGRPGVVVRRVAAEDVEVDLYETDPGSGGRAALPKVRKGEIVLTGLSDRPHVHDQPVELSLEGDLGTDTFGWAALAVDCTLDVREGVEDRLAFGARAELVPVQVLAELIGDTLPVRLEAGRIGFSASSSVALNDPDGRFLQPFRPRLAFRGVRIAAKNPQGKIAGLPASDFVRAFNEASEALGDDTPLEIADLEIGGSLARPEFTWGDTVRNLVLEGGKAFARKELARLEGKVSSEAGKIAQTLGAEAGEELQRVLGESGLGEEAQESLEDLLPGEGEEATGKPAEDATRKAFDLIPKGVLGGDSSKKE